MIKTDTPRDPSSLASRLVADAQRLDQLNALWRENHAAIAEGHDPLVDAAAITCMEQEQSQFRTRVTTGAALLEAWYLASGKTMAPASRRAMVVGAALQRLGDTADADKVAEGLSGIHFQPGT